MGQKKKVCLVDQVGCRQVEFRARKVSRRRKIDLSVCLISYCLAASSGTASANFLMAEVPFQLPREL